MGTKTAHLTKFAFGKLQVRQRNCSLSTLEKLNSLRLDKKIVKFKKKKIQLPISALVEHGLGVWITQHQIVSFPSAPSSYQEAFDERSYKSSRLN